MMSEQHAMTEQHATPEQSGGLAGSSGSMPEFVLCCFCPDVPEGLTSLDTSADLARYFNPSRMVLLPRDEVEQCSWPRQIVAYVVLVRGPHVFCYRRIPGTGEPDLAGRRSVGLGGHVNAADVVSAEGLDLAFVAWFAAQREASEEISEDSSASVLSLKPVALLYDPSDVVGRRHVGIVYRAEIGGRGAIRLRPGLESLGWKTPGEVLGGDGPPLESWSRIVLGRPEVLGLEERL